MKNQVILIVLVLCSWALAFSGAISTDTTWNSSTVHITDDVMIYNTATLNISAGTNVLIDSGVVFGIGGRLITNGTESNPVVFTYPSN